MNSRLSARLRGEATFAQAFDPALHFGYSNRMQIVRVTAYNDLARATENELAANFLLGREIVLPAGHMLDNPFFYHFVRRVIIPFLSRRERIREALADTGISWSPFRMSLNPEYSSIRHLLSQYVVTPASYPLFAERPQQEQYSEMRNLARAFVAGNHVEMASIVGDPDLTIVYEAIDKYLDDDAIHRPIRSVTPDFLAVLRSRLESDTASQVLPDVSEAKRFLDGIDRGSDAGDFQAIRGAWFVRREELAGMWPAMQVWLDAEHARLNMLRNGVSSASLRTRPLNSTLQDTMIESPVLPSSAPPGDIDWDCFWERFTQTDFLRSLRTYLIDRSRGATGLTPALDLHATFIVKNAEGLDFDLDQFRTRLAATKEKEAAKKRLEKAIISSSSPKGLELVLSFAQAINPAWYARITGALNARKTKIIGAVTTAPTEESSAQISALIDRRELKATTQLCDYVQFTSTMGDYVDMTELGNGTAEQ